MSELDVLDSAEFELVCNVHLANSVSEINEANNTHTTTVFF